MKTLQWKEPPPAESNRGLHAETREIIDQLKANPGKWALVVESATSSGATTRWKKRGCEATIRRAEKVNGKYRYDVYARWPEKPAEGGRNEGAGAPSTVTKPGPRPAPAAPKPAAPPAASSGERPAPSGDPGLDNYMAQRRQRTGAGSVNGL